MSVNFIHFPQNEKDTFPYFQRMADNFPAIQKELEEEDMDMIFFKMERFAAYTNDQIAKSNRSELIRCFEFQESEIDAMNEILLNVLDVSYCEALLLGDHSSEMNWVKELMPEKLKTRYNEYEKFYDGLFK